VFDKFRHLSEEESLSRRLHALAERAGAPRSLRGVADRFSLELTGDRAAYAVSITTWRPRISAIFGRRMALLLAVPASDSA
jgi:hypothetical protein